MYERSKILALALICLLPICLVVSVIPRQDQETKIAIEEYCSFEISSWEFPADEHGQGIYGFFVGDNYTGSFLWNSGHWSGPLFLSTRENNTFMAYANTYLGFDFRVYYNYTLSGLTHPDDILIPALNYIRLNISVTLNNVEVFSQSNFTYSFGGLVETGMWFYSFEIEMDSFVLMNGMSYTIIVNYEVFY